MAADPNIPDPHDINTGIRAAMFYMLPNWKYDVTVEYKFMTTISMTRRKVEQRRALHTVPKRLQSFIVTTSENQEMIWNYLLYLRDQNIIMSLYVEPCLPNGSGTLLGDTSIVCTNDLPNYYNLNNLTSRVILMDKRDILKPESRNLASVNNYTINLSNPVVGNFQREYTVIFPMLNCYLTSFKKKSFTDTVAHFTLEFLEMF